MPRKLTIHVIATAAMPKGRPLGASRQSFIWDGELKRFGIRVGFFV